MLSVEWSCVDTDSKELKDQIVVLVAGLGRVSHVDSQMEPIAFALREESAIGRSADEQIHYPRCR